ncbi:hypothetical protein VUR80DRAFT_1695 [Thermomyces stellatus]
MIARQHYALDVRFPAKLARQMVEKYREISRLWDQFLCGGARWQIEDAGVKRERAGTGGTGPGAKRAKQKAGAGEGSAEGERDGSSARA